MREELLYTQEDIDEWMRACDELQVHLRELEDGIKAKDKQLAKYKGALELACIKFEENDKAFLLKSKWKSKEQHQKEFLNQAKKELEEQDVKD